MASSGIIYAKHMQTLVQSLISIHQRSIVLWHGLQLPTYQIIHLTNALKVR